MMKRPELKPTLNQTFELVGRGEYDFASVLDRSMRLQSENRIGEACNVRYAAVQRLMEVLPEDEEIVLEWGHRNSRAALELLQASASDHFLIGDLEMAAALAELLLELDPEDHLESVWLAGFWYVAMGEYELFDEIADDISDKSPEKHILTLWSHFRRTGELPAAEAAAFRGRFATCFNEFTADEHPVDEEYMADIEKDAPSQRTQARHLWFQTESLWSQHPGFIEALRRCR